MYLHGYLEVGTDQQDFLDVFEGGLTAHPAWAFIEDHNGNRIWRNLGSENDFGADFHIAFRMINTSTMRMHAFENWDTNTKGLRRPCVRGSSAHNCGADASLDNGEEKTSGIYYFDGSNIFKPTVHVPDDGGLEYWISITHNRIIMATRRDSDLGTSNVYIGHFETFIPDHPNENPLVCMQPEQTSTSLTSYLVGGWSRHPGREDAGNIRENFAVYPTIAGANSDWTKTYGTVGSPGSYDPFHNQPIGSRLLCRPLSSSFQTYGYMRGLYFEMLDISVVSGVRLGDTVSISGETWVYLGANGNWMNTEV